MDMFWIWSNEHGMWWGPGRRGYVRDLSEAGLYSDEQAAEIVADANIAQMKRPWLKRNEVAIPALPTAAFAEAHDPTIADRLHAALDEYRAAKQDPAGSVP
jgi:hypothetical protein